MTQMLYIHIPFCRHKCSYCDFVSGTNIGLKTRYIQAISQEIAHQEKGEADTLYMGGGTPSLLSVDEVNQLKNIVSQHYDITNLKEWTIECNPEDLTENWLEGILKLGVTRLSIGIQSLDDAQLQWMERRHTARQAIDSVRLAQKIGFSNISCDLIFGLPGEGFQRTLDRILDLNPQHISAYQLMMEEGSKLTKKGIHGVDDDTSYEMYKKITHDLKSAGYEHYEISNYAKPGFRSIHNSGYWSGRSYIGLGPAAHSFDGNSTRKWNIPNTLKYCNLLENTLTPVETRPATSPTTPCPVETRPATSPHNHLWYDTEHLTPTDRFNETIMLGLRTCEGVNLPHLTSTFGTQLTQSFLTSIQKFPDHILITDSSVRLTEDALFISDSIISEAMIVR